MSRLTQKFQTVEAFNRELERISKQWTQRPSNGRTDYSLEEIRTVEQQAKRLNRWRGR